MTAHNLPDLAGTRLLAALSDYQFDGPKFFALVNADDPNQVYYYGLDVGECAFTVRTDPDTQHTNFGSWNSPESACHRLASFTGGHIRMALMLFDSVPVAVKMALGPGSGPGTDALGWFTAVPAIDAADPEAADPS